MDNPTIELIAAMSHYVYELAYHSTIEAHGGQMHEAPVVEHMGSQ